MIVTGDRETVRFYFYLFSLFFQAWGFHCPEQSTGLHYWWPTYCKKISFPSLTFRGICKCLRNEGRVMMMWVEWKYFIKLKLLEVSALNICSILFLRDLPLNCSSPWLSLLDPQIWGHGASPRFLYTWPWSSLNYSYNILVTRLAVHIGA